MGAILKIISGAFSLVNAWLTGKQREEDKKSGAQEVELTQIKEGLDAQKKAKAVRKDKPKRNRKQHLDRL